MPIKEAWILKKTTIVQSQNILAAMLLLSIQFFDLPILDFAGVWNILPDGVLKSYCFCLS